MAKSTQLKRVFYTPGELARMIGLNYRTVLTMCQREDIPTAKFGLSRQYLIPAAWVDQAVDGTLDHWFKVMAARGLISPQETTDPDEPVHS